MKYILGILLFGTIWLIPFSNAFAQSFYLKISEVDQNSQEVDTYKISDNSNSFWQIDSSSFLSISILSTQPGEEGIAQNFTKRIVSIRFQAFNTLQKQIADSMISTFNNSVLKYEFKQFNNSPLWNNLNNKYILTVIYRDSHNSVKIDTQSISFIRKRYKVKVLVNLDELAASSFEGLLTTAAKTQVNLSYVFGENKGNYAVFHIPVIRIESKNWLLENLELGVELPVTIDDKIQLKGWGGGFGFLRNKYDKTLIQIGLVSQTVNSEKNSINFFMGAEVSSLIDWVREQFP